MPIFVAWRCGVKPERKWIYCENAVSFIRFPVFEDRKYEQFRQLAGAWMLSKKQLWQTISGKNGETSMASISRLQCRDSDNPMILLGVDGFAQSLKQSLQFTS